MMANTVAKMGLAAFAGLMTLAATAKVSVDLCGTWEFMRENGPWTKVSVPHDWSIAAAPAEREPTGKCWGYYPAGKGTYRRTFELTAEDLQKDLRLNFDGILGLSRVAVNDAAPVAGTRYGYTGFSVPLNGKVKAGRNVVTVTVGNSHLPASRWYMGSGIFRPVVLEKRESVHLVPGSLVAEGIDSVRRPTGRSTSVRTRSRRVRMISRTPCRPRAGRARLGRDARWELFGELTRREAALHRR